MYKTKLQELCHQKSWSLPEYSTTKDGPIHAPSFTATVTLNGVSFQTQEPGKSIKEAQNQAAKLAFDHFTAPPRPPPDSPVADAPSEYPNIIDELSRLEMIQPKLPETYQTSEVNETSLQPKLPETYQTSEVNETSSGAKDDAGFTELRHLCKNQLQMYAQKRNLLLPTYSCERDGPPHASRFKCKVTIDGKTFESPDYFKTLKDAEHAAARVALMALSSGGVEENEAGVYKNLLQELTQKKGYQLPLYETSSYGGHLVYFISTVEIEGEKFTGEQGKTKKQAEMNAAKTAYTILKERKQGQNSSSPSPSHQPKVSPSPVSSQRNATPAIRLDISAASAPVSNSSISIGGRKEVREEFLTQNSNLFPSPAVEEPSMRYKDPSLSDMVYAQLRYPFPSGVSPEGGSPGSTSPSDDGNLVRESDVEMPSEVYYSPCNVVRVYPRSQNQTFPEGTVAFSDENWVTVIVRANPSPASHSN